MLAAGLAAALCALVLDERDLLRVAAFVTALPLLAVWLSGRVRLGLSARRELVANRIAVDSETTVRLHLNGRGRVSAGGLHLEDGVPYALGGRPRFLLERPPRDRGTIVEYRVRPALRGIHRIGPLRSRVRDPFGLAEFERELGEHSRLIAVPRVVPLAGTPTGSGIGVGEDGTRSLRAGHSEDDTMVREYRHGDDMRRVHWKATAHRDELMVRLEENPRHGGVTVLLDNRAAAHRGTGAQSSLEWAVSAAASICLHLHARGQRVRLVTADGRPLANGSGRHGGDDGTVVLDALAALQPSPQRDLMCGADPGAGRELIAVLGATTTAGITELTKLRPHGAQSLAVLLNVRGWNDADTDGGFDAGETASRLRASGWAVATVDGPNSALATVWERLCGQDSSARDTAVTT
ncbi:uncharacterized protein (DUF58 family) [Haloactinomyces albus]|uniref:Uncharacterized protein (DUF58 family) n=1 Tax=Haloactinomyces albus TaxID=1352928 RepID=A0AAE3Z928_9ACTN|nr:DUF58 domain-containing protein [Haloactinomyces albus]MDR7300587.1 uncharacterized protein (DUF58 family) [Haloactinomyces albus]